MAHQKRNRKDTRDKNQVHDTQGEAQNVTDGPKNSDDKNMTHARAKATEGIRQGRDVKQESWNNNVERKNDEINPKSPK